MNTIDDYISQFSIEIREKLNLLRRIISETAPQATEKISYEMPAFHWKENVIYFAAYKTHIGIYPTPKPIDIFKEELKSFECSKGTIKIAHTQELPIKLIEKIVRFRIEEITKKKK